MDGILLINKPKDFSSHDVVAVLRGILKTKKIGHSGTLDPDATGLLVVGVNKGTKIMRYLNQDDKTYEATICIGTATTTLDNSGDIIKQKHVSQLTKFDAVLDTFKGEICQIPPMYSAIKYRGKRLYEYARKGVVIDDRPKRSIQIYDIKRTSEITYQDGLAFVSYQVTGSKGLYVRTLSYDIAKKLGYPGHNYALNRTQAGAFQLEQAYTLEQVRNGAYRIVSLSDALSHLPKVIATDAIKTDVKHGRLLSLSHFNAPTQTRIVDSDNKLLAIYHKHPTKHAMKPINVFNEE